MANIGIFCGSRKNSVCQVQVCAPKRERENMFTRKKVRAKRTTFKIMSNWNLKKGKRKMEEKTKAKCTEQENITRLKQKPTHIVFYS